MHVQVSRPPAGFEECVFEKFIKIPNADSLIKFWELLNLRETFVAPQIFPYKVEFDSAKQVGPFETGELNIHHGPLLSVHGVIGEISDSYRDLQYFYGSYVLSFRLVRPTRLEFFREEAGIRLKLHSLVKPWFVPFWLAGNRFFWRFFNLK